MQKIIEGLSISIDESLKNLFDKKFNLSELRSEQEKFCNFLSKLRKIKDSKYCVNNDQIEIWFFLNQLDIQTTSVIKALETFEDIDKDIFMKLMNDELMNLKNLIIEEKIKSEKSQNVSFQCIQEKVIKEDEILVYSKSNQNEEMQLNDQIEKVTENYQIVEKDVNTVVKQNNQEFKFYSNENHSTYLVLMIKVVKLQLEQIKELKKLLHKLLEEITTFSQKLDQIKIYNQEIQINFQKNFISRFQELIKNFEQQKLTQINFQQKDNESFQLYFERIQTNLSRGTNEMETNQTQTNISDFLNLLKVHLQEKLVELKYFANIPNEQEFLIQQIRKLYLQNNNEENDEKSNQKLGQQDIMNQKYQDFKSNEEWKIKQGVVFTIIQISSNCLTDSINSFCQKALIQLWVQEKDQRIRNLLKDQNLIRVQMKILQKDWSTQHDRISGEMQKMLSRIDELQEQISHEANLNKRDLLLKEMDETTEQLDEYIENISQMGQQFKLITDFVNHIRKGLVRVEGKINELKEQLNGMNNDIKFLRGKSVEQLLEIRKWKVLKEAAYNNIKSIYVPLKTQEKGKNDLSNLMNLEQFDDKGGEVNEFLQEEKTVLLIHGIAGSGKSTTAKKIEEFIWKLHDSNTKIGKYVLIPVYISLPSLKNPVFQAVEEALHQDDYGFDELQLKECKEMLEKKECRFLLIMDSYDEMKLENIQKNLYISNKLKQNWSDPLVIFTTRSEIFTSSNYALWFAPNDKEKLKEIELLKFNSEQMIEYLTKFTIQSIKMLIFEIYEWQTQISNRGVIDINKFETCWDKLKQQFLKQEVQKLNVETLLNKKQIESIQSFLKNNEFIALKSYEVLRSLSINLQKLWSVERYDNMMKSINLHKLVETPYMMEIIVQVLPEMIVKATDIINLKQLFIKNFPNMLKEFYMSQYLIQKYQQQKKKFLLPLNNESELQSQKDDGENLEVIVTIKIFFCQLRNNYEKQFIFDDIILDSLKVYHCLDNNTYKILFPKENFYQFQSKFEKNQKYILNFIYKF